MITINNPFWDSNFEEVDIENTDLPNKSKSILLGFVNFLKEREK